METIIRNSNEMDTFAARQLAVILEKRKSAPNASAMVVGLSGGLGAGKTTFVQALARALLIEESVTSPTFVIARFYPVQKLESLTRLVHIDAYRIEDESELGPIRFDEILGESKNLVVVEWPEKIAARFPDTATRLYFEVLDETTRIIKEKPGIE